MITARGWRCSAFMRCDFTLVEAQHNRRSRTSTSHFRSGITLFKKDKLTCLPLIANRVPSRCTVCLFRRSAETRKDLDDERRGSLIRNLDSGSTSVSRVSL